MVAQQTSIRALQARWAPFLVLVLFLPDFVRAGERPYEIGGAQEEVGRIRELAERLSKQNLFYQLHLADQKKQDLHDTAAELQRSLDLLREGSVAYSVTAPPNDEIRAQIARVEEAWGPLERLARASPYDYLRRASEFIPRRHRFGDPLYIRSFDRISQALIEEVDRLMALYEKECMKTDYELCNLASTHGIPIMLTERVVKELVFLYTSFGDKGDRERLRETRDAVDAEHSELTQLPVLQEMTDPSRGDAAAFVSSLWGGVNEDWSRLRPEIELAIAGRASEINLKKVLKIQARLIETWERLTVVTLRFVEAKYAS
jgi:hypothetical protein